MFDITLMHPDTRELSTLKYDQERSLLTYEDGMRVPLDRVGMSYAAQPETPSKGLPAAITKGSDIRHIRVMLGKECNFKCGYCLQAEFQKEGDTDEEDARKFIENLPKWFKGGSNGRGEGVQFEFWGGEPLVYLKKIKYLASEIKARYPEARLMIITNGYLIDEAFVDWVIEYDVMVGISHDGPLQSVRGPDPLDKPASLATFQRLFRERHGHISFNVVLTKDNCDLVMIRQWFESRIGFSVNIGGEGVITVHDIAALAYSPLGIDEQRDMWRMLASSMATPNGAAMLLTRQMCFNFYQSLVHQTPMSSVTYNCSLEKECTLAVDLKGQVATCHNVSTTGKHLIGTVDNLGAIANTEAWTRWQDREGCSHCPFIHTCRGSCMVIEDPFWDQNCDNLFTYHYASFAVALWVLTGLRLVSISGDRVRREGVTEVAF